MNKLKCVLLVDDDPTTNFLNNELLEDLDIAENVHVVTNGKKALEYITLSGEYKGKSKITHPSPNIIFLDINMPLMGGLQFLMQYAKLPNSKKKNTIIICLSTSNSKKDRLEFESTEYVFDFIEKPLRKNAILQILEAYNKTLVVNR